MSTPCKSCVRLIDELCKRVEQLNDAHRHQGLIRGELEVLQAENETLRCESLNAMRAKLMKEAGCE